jgi:hypothetical protein
MYAAISDNLDAAQWLIEVGNADPNRICKAGYSVLMYTTRNYQSQVGSYLIKEIKVDISITAPVRNFLQWLLIYFIGTLMSFQDGKTATEQRLEFESWYEQQAILEEA